MMKSAEKKTKSRLLPFSHIHNATLFGDLEQVKKLVEGGVNPMERDISGSILLHFAAIWGELEILKYLVEDIGCNPATQDDKLYTALHFSAFHGHLNTVQYLVDQCQLDTTAVNDDGHYALHLACRGGHLQIVKYLLSAMHDYNQLYNIVSEPEKSDNPFERFVQLAIAEATSNGHLPVLQYLIRYFKCDAFDYYDITSPLAIAAGNDQIHVLKYLIDQKLVKRSVDEC